MLCGARWKKLEVIKDEVKWLKILALKFCFSV
jgi:hypothetical protein